jgi:hypothetical protein
MSTPIEGSLQTVTTTTFQDLGFLFGPVHVGGPQSPGPDEPVVGVCFRGAFEGELIVRAEEGTLPALAERLAGGSYADSAARHVAALREAVKLLCKHLLQSVVYPGQAFELDAPRPKDAAISGVPGTSLRARTSLVLETGCLEVRLFTTGLPARLEAAA